MSTEAAVKDLADGLYKEFIGEAETLLKTVRDEDKEFFAHVAERMADAHIDMRVGDEDTKRKARRRLNSLITGMELRVSRRAMRFVRFGKERLLAMLKTVGKTLLKVALVAIL
jgi:hypothetical protein